MFYRDSEFYTSASSIEACSKEDALYVDIEHYDELTAERDALVAQIEQLRLKAKKLIFQAERALECDIGNYHTLKGTAYALDNWLDSTPAQCLAERDSEVAASAFADGGSAQKAFWDGFERGAINGAANIRQHWNEYLQLRQQAKGGE